MVGRPRRRRPGALETEVLDALSMAGRPLSAADVRAALPVALAYTTVATTLRRLHEKGALTRGLEDRTHVYAVAGARTAATERLVAHRMHRVLESGADRRGVLASFVDVLDEEEGRLLAELLRTTTPAADGATDPDGGTDEGEGR